MVSTRSRPSRTRATTQGNVLDVRLGGGDYPGQVSSDESDASAQPSRPEASSDRPLHRPPTGGRSGGLAGPLLLYTALRVGLIAGLTAVLALFMPLIVALLFAIIVQLPLAWLLFAGQRRQVNERLAATSAHRRAERERLRAALAGEDNDPAPGRPAP